MLSVRTTAPVATTTGEQTQPATAIKKDSKVPAPTAGDKQLSIQPNIGIGLKIKSLSLDYALTDIGDNSVALYSNIFSLKFDLFKRPSS